MKKIMMIVIMGIGLLTLSACNEPSTYSFSFFDYMDTYINISMQKTTEKTVEKHKAVIEDIFRTYHELSNNYEPLDEASVFLENIYTINQKNNQLIEIDQALYELIEESERIKDLTDGYFDISVGEVVHIWKTLILDESNGYLFEEIPKDIFDEAIVEIGKITIEEDVIELTRSQDAYYIQVNSDHVQLDLGAISKGYATQKVYEYVIEQDIQYFSISAGSSSIVIGKNSDRDEDIFIVSLANPVKTGIDDRTYGKIYVKDIGITTSGNYEQYALYEGLRYHHIISPITQMPMQYYHTITILGDDLGVLDAVSTAMFSMSPEVLENWLVEHQEAMNIEVIRFNYDATITTHLKATVFEENPS